MFKSNADFGVAVPKLILLAVVLVILTATYSQALFIRLGVPKSLTLILTNMVNILIQVVISYPAMKFWVMPDKK